MKKPPERVDDSGIEIIERLRYKEGPLEDHLIRKASKPQFIRMNEREVHQGQEIDYKIKQDE